MTPAAQVRASRLHTARVLLAEASRRRGGGVNRDFYWQLLAGVARFRRLVAAQREPVQGRLL